MSAVSEKIVREYFEMRGFLVHQPVRYQVMARAKKAEEQIDLVVCRPSAKDEPLPDFGLWRQAELAHVTRAVVGVRGWHTERFTPAVLETSPDIFRFAERDVMRRVQTLVGEGTTARILCLPELPASRHLRRDALALLEERGIDGIILFRTLLSELCEGLDVNKSYEKSDLLQLLRILKAHDLIRGPQLELFRKGRGGRARREAVD